MQRIHSNYNRILNKYFNNTTDAEKVVKEIEVVVDNKVELKTTGLATKEDLLNVKAEIKDDLLKVHEKLNDQFKWLIGTMIALTSLALVITKVL